MTRRRGFTLLELLMVMMVVAVVTAWMGVKGREWLRYERFQGQARTVLSKLNMAQELMLVLGADCEVHLKRNERGNWEIFVRTDKPLPVGLSGLIGRKEDLGGLSSIYWKGDGQREDHWVVRFFSNGGAMTDGDLILEGAGRQRVIQLPGYPRHLSFGERQIDEQWYADSETLYPGEIRLRIEEKAVPPT